MELTKAAFVLAGFVLVACSALPAIKDDVEYIPPRGTFGKHPVVDTGYFGDWGNPFARGPFGLFDNLEGIMDRMRKQIAALLGQFPIPGGTNSTDDLAGFPSSFPSLAGSFPSVGDIDLSKGNTTSVTKIINGHKVIINETEYKNEDENGGTFFNVRIVEVAPDSSEVTTEQEAESVPAQKDIDNSFENEIPKSKEVGRAADAPEKLRNYA